jgi:hypothetical protein
MFVFALTVQDGLHNDALRGGVAIVPMALLFLAGRPGAVSRRREELSNMLPELPPSRALTTHQRQSIPAVIDAEQARPSTHRRTLSLAGLPLAGLCLAALAMGATMIARNPDDGRHYAATPAALVYDAMPSDQTAHDLLLHYAAAASRQPADPAGAYQYQRTRSWSLATRIDGSTVTSRVIASTSELWRAANGAGGYRTNEATAARTQPPGTPMMYDVSALSHDPATLLRQFHRAHPADLGAAEVVTAFTDLWQQQVPPPALEAAALRVLAGQEGIVVRGTTTDRAGRPGVAVSVDSDYSGLPTRYTLIFNPATGMLLDTERHSPPPQDASTSPSPQSSATRYGSPTAQHTPSDRSPAHSAPPEPRLPAAWALARIQDPGQCQAEVRTMIRAAR